MAAVITPCEVPRMSCGTKRDRDFDEAFLQFVESNEASALVEIEGKTFEQVYMAMRYRAKETPGIYVTSRSRKVFLLRDGRGQADERNQRD